MPVRILVLFVLYFFSVTCFAEKERRHALPVCTPAEQMDYIDGLLSEAKERMAGHDYSAAQALLTERCDLLDLYYEANGTTRIQEGNTGYEYRVFVPKLYCNLRIGHVADNMAEIAHLREQYRKLFHQRHPQDDLLETEVAETYYRIGNIGMAIETAEKLIDRLFKNRETTSPAYHRVYYRLMAYYKSIGRSDTPYFASTYKPKDEIKDTASLENMIYGDQPFEQKLKGLVERAASLMADGEDRLARLPLEVALGLLEDELPKERRSADAESDRTYRLLKGQLLALQAKTYYDIYFPDDEAEECLLRDYEYRKELYGVNSAEVADAAQELGDYYYIVLDEYAEATGFYLQAYNILKSASEFRKGQLIEVLGAMMNCYAHLGEAKAVANLAKELIVGTKDLVITSFKVGSSAERAALWDKYNHWLLKDIPRLALKFEGQIELGAELYDIALFSKGLLMVSDHAMTELVQKKGGNELKTEGRKLHNLRLQLHEQLTSSDLSELRKVNDTRRKIEEIEHSLVTKVNELGDWQQGLNISWRDIQRGLKKGETAIEFLEYEELWSKGAIIALVLNHDSYSPVMRLLGSHDELEYSESFSHCKTTEFYENYWRKVESDLSETSSIFFAPVGMLNTIPVEYCPVDEKNALFDKYEMYRLTSTRKILERGSSKTHISSAYLFGGIDYTPDLNEIKAANVALINEGFVAEGTSGLKKYMKFDTSRYVTNGIENRMNWMNIYTTTLSSTALLSDFLELMGCHVNFFNKYRATEECFKGMSTKPIDLLVVNTHGFTFDAREVKDGDYSFTYKRSVNSVSRSEYAMTLSGLLLTGASMAYSPESDRDNLEDGIITAAEIAQLNLKNVQLVHLSACETGLGELTAEGVIGLQRGFKRAGAKAIINTLAPAYTNVITYFDTTFYHNLFFDQNGKKRKNQSLHDAFTKTVKKVKSIYDDPKYWCVNVLIDAVD